MRLINQSMPAENKARAGIATIHTVRISPVTLQQTFPNRSDAPTPMIAELTTCVVLNGRRHLSGKTMHRADLIKLAA